MARSVRARVDPQTGRRSLPARSDAGLEPSLRPLLARLAERDRARSEATLQADIRQVLLVGSFGLDDGDVEVRLENQVGGGRRIDIEAGRTVIEVKKDIRSGRVARRAEEQLAGYVRSRSEQTGQRYVGLLTDGVEWRTYHLRGGELELVQSRLLNSTSLDIVGFFYWLEGVLATSRNIPSTPDEIRRRLGSDSSSYRVDHATLTALYHENAATPTVQLKRRLWAQLLESALGTQFVDDAELFIEHTLLMNSADVIAHLVMGLDVMDLQPATLLSGQRFGQAGILGVVEQDFFDWTIEVPGGASFVQDLARRLAKFDWSRVEHDVLKILYEEIIGAETRKRMGEYYTPDWLAEHVVETTVTMPLKQKVLDPACGSGTFLFHAVRRYLHAAEATGMGLKAALTNLSQRVIGVDLHPVAVALARVTYLLAIGRERLTDERRGPITIPVYLGDSIQWREKLDLFTEDHLRISAGHGASLLEDILRFPEHLLADPGRFDHLVAQLAALAAKPRDRSTVPSLDGLFSLMAIAEDDQPMIRETFSAMCRLHDEGRNHIWSYYIRNLARPVWLAMHENRVDTLIGNPPWLSYRHMPADMQSIFRELCQDRGLWHGGDVATQQDLSALFVSRAIQQYLAISGSFAFVMPNAVLDREYYRGFRAGLYKDPAEPTAVAFTRTWDLRRLRPHPFPRGSGVVLGRRVALGNHRSMPPVTERWSGRVPPDSTSWQSVAPHLQRRHAKLAVADGTGQQSPYARRFTNGATIFPRVLFFVDSEPVGPLGLVGGRRAVRSATSNYEKPPWKDIDRLEGHVEVEFVKPVLLGESVLPFRVLPARDAVIPLEGTTLLHGEHPRLDYYPCLADWWRHAEEEWNRNRNSDRLTLAEQLDFRRKLSAQLPAAPLRLVYGKAGMHVAATIVDNPNAVIDHKLYWATITSRQEGLYLSAILNSPAITDLVRPLMSYGKDERDIDKHVWKLPIPLFDRTDPDHMRLTELGQTLAETVAGMPLDETANFVALRRRVRTEIASHSAATEVDAIVTELLG